VATKNPSSIFITDARAESQLSDKDKIIHTDKRKKEMMMNMKKKSESRIFKGSANRLNSADLQGSQEGGISQEDPDVTIPILGNIKRD